MIHKFWQGHQEKYFNIHLMSWDIHGHKTVWHSKYSIIIKTMPKVLLNNHDTFVAVVYKTKYFSNCTILDARLGKIHSFA
jgi:hypothetical protein